MHWTLGKRRQQHMTAIEAAAATAKSTRVAAAIGLIGALATVGTAVTAEVVDNQPPEVLICTAVAIQDYSSLYDSGSISHEEFEQLRSDAISDQLEDSAPC